MFTRKIPIIVFALLTIVTFPFKLLFFESDSVSSVIPGWHTTIFPPYFVAGLVVSFFVFINFIGYCGLSKRKIEISPKLFLLHLVLISPAIFITDLIELTEPNTVVAHIVPIVAYLLFIVAQIMFGFVLFRKNMR